MTSERSEGSYQAGLVDPPAPRRDAVWTTLDKRQIRILELEDSHLVSILRMLRRKFVTMEEFLSALAYASSPMIGDMAQLALEQEIADMKVMPSIYDDLKAEAAARGLDWEVPR